MSTLVQGPRIVRHVGLLIVALVIVIPPVHADVNPVVAPAAKESSRKEKLRYKGKSFEEWRERFLTEIDPETRQESLQGLAVFARHGFARETVAAILDVAREYDDVIAADFETGKKRDQEGLELDETEAADLQVLVACFAVVKKTGLAALPALREGLKGDHVGVHYFAAEVLLDMGTAGQEAIPELIALTKSKARASREIAASTLASVGEKDPKVVDLLQTILKDGDPGMRIAVLSALQDSPVMARQFAPAILTALRDKDAAVCEAALGALAKADAGPQAVHMLVRLLRRTDVKSQLVYAQLKSLGAQAKPAVPVLLANLERAGQKQGPADETCLNIVDTLAAIGPGAADAVPALKKLLAAAEAAPVREPAAVGVAVESPSPTGSSVTERIRRALDAIQSTPPPPQGGFR